MAMALPMPARRTSISLLWASLRWPSFSNRMLGYELSGPEPLFSSHVPFGVHFMLQYKLWNCQPQRTYSNFFRKRGVKALCFKSQKISKGTGKKENKKFKILYAGCRLCTFSVVGGENAVVQEAFYKGDDQEAGLH